MRPCTLWKLGPSILFPYDRAWGRHGSTAGQRAGVGKTAGTSGLWMTPQDRPEWAGRLGRGSWPEGRLEPGYFDLYVEPFDKRGPGQLRKGVR